MEAKCGVKVPVNPPELSRLSDHAELGSGATIDELTQRLPLVVSTENCRRLWYYDYIYNSCTSSTRTQKRSLAEAGGLG
jgi:hypothetical protein